MAGRTAAHGNQNVMSEHRFAAVPAPKIERSSFDRSSGLKTSFRFGWLVPVYVDEALPGDTFNLSTSIFGRFQTMWTPVFENIFLDFFFFAVPVRLLWSNWQKMNGQQTNPGDSTSFLVPISTAPAGGYLECSLQDYLGLPTKVAGYTHSALYPRAYNLIFNEWFRDENLTNSAVVDQGDGPDTVTNYVLRKRAKRHDYFTSCLPWPQKGTAVSLPLGTTAPVISTGDGIPQFIGAAGGGNISALEYQTAAPAHVGLSSVGGGQPFANLEDLKWSSTKLVTDLTTATAATINQLREAFQVQKLLERDARGGTRYTEILRSHFGVVSPDQRLQRPEFLGGGSSRINVNPVAVTNYNAASSVYPGNLGGFGTFSGDGIGFSKSFVEHCVIMGLVAARSDLNYQQGLDRMFSRRTRYDFYWPAFAHLGEQAVLNKEIYCKGDANDPLTFGYQERYAEYRYKPSRVTGTMRSNATDTLDWYHLAQDFSALPALNNAFIEESPPIDRIITVNESTEPSLRLDAWFALRCARPMPTYSVPGLIDHF